MRITSLLTAFCITAWSTAAAQHSLRESTASYLLLNSDRIASSDHVELVPGKPEKHAGNPIMVEDKPWEVRYGDLSANVIFDPFEKFFKGWFSPFIVSESTAQAGTAREAGVLYGTSHNGELWNKPLLDLNPWSDGTKTNILVREAYGASVFRDQRDASRLYKMIYSTGNKLATRTSADGIRWSSATDATEATEEAHTSAFWASDRREYVALTTMKHGDERSIGRTSSKDFVKWTPVTPALKGLTAGQQVIALPVLPLGGVFLGFPVIHDIEQDRVHTELAWSADTVEWQRIAAGTPFIENGEKGSYDWGSAFVGSVIAMNDGVRIFYSGSDDVLSGSGKGSLNLARLGVDSFAGYRAAEGQTGTLQLKPLPYHGSKVRLTADIAPGGFVAVSAEDKDGNNLISSTRIEVGGADVELETTIPKGTKDLAISLRLQNATVYSIGFK
ncbi:MAG: hypothetical protein KDN22_21165 [Verrucomicrobiae bacterium]|nr:hypothetical protein [Verrucomicrobiae bacterium]